MTSSVLISPRSPIVKIVDVSKVGMAPIQTQIYGVQRLPTDPIGAFALELTNVVIGSRIHIEIQGDGTTLHDSVADATSETISLSAYASGSPYNALRIKVRKGTGSPTYKPFETLATTIVGAQSIYVGQIADE